MTKKSLLNQPGLCGCGPESHQKLMNIITCNLIALQMSNTVLRARSTVTLPNGGQNSSSNGIQIVCFDRLHLVSVPGCRPY